jgi:hypothetical protein
MIRRAMCASLLCAVVTPTLTVLASTPAAAETSIAGVLAADTTLTAADSPYVLTGDVVVPEGVTLTVEQGVTVTRSPYSSSAVVVDGVLDVAGTAVEPVVWSHAGDFYNSSPFIRPGTQQTGSVSLVSVTSTRQTLVADANSTAAEFSSFDLLDSRLRDSEVRVDASIGDLVVARNVFAQRGLEVADPTPDTTFVADNRFRTASLTCGGTGRLELRANTFEHQMQWPYGSNVASLGDCVIDADDNFWEASAAVVRSSRLQGSERIQLSAVASGPSADTPSITPAAQTQERLTDDFGRSVLRVRTGSDGGAPATITAAAVNRETDVIEETHTVPAPPWDVDSQSVDITFSDLVAGRLYRLTTTVANEVGPNEPVETDSFLAPEQTDGPAPAPGTITQDTSWTADMSPIVLSQPVTIPAGVTLTIDAGVEVRSPENYYDGLFVLRGALVSAGTADNPVSITSSSCCNSSLVAVPPDSAQSSSLRLSHTRIAGQNVRLLGNATPGTLAILDSRLDGVSTGLDGSSGEVTFERNRIVGSFNQSFDIANPAEGEVVVQDNRFRRMDVTCSGAGRLTMSGNTFERTSRAGSADDCVLDLRGNHWETPDSGIGGRIIGAGRVTALPTAASPSVATPNLEPDAISIYRYDWQDATAVQLSAGSDGGAPSTITALAIDRETGDTVETRTLPLEQAQNGEAVLQFSALQPGRLYRISAYGENTAGRTAIVDTESFVVPEGQEEPEPDGGTLVSGTIASDTTWQIEDSPFTVVGPLVIPAGRTLTVEPGVIVRGRSINGSTPLIRVGGTFDARGQDGLPIVIDAAAFGCCRIFTSPRDLDGGVVSFEHVVLRAGSDANRLWARYSASDRAAARITIADSVLMGISVDAYDIEGTTLEISRSAWTGGRLSLSDVQPTTTLTHNRFRSTDLSCAGSGRLTATHNTFERDSVYLSSQDDCILDVSSSHWEVPDAQVPGRISGAARAIVRPIASTPSSDTPRLSPAQPYISYRLTEAGEVVTFVYPGSDGGAAASVTTRLVDRETGEVVSDSVELSTAPGQEIITRFDGLSAGQLYRVSAVAENAVGTSPESTTESFLAPRSGPAAPTGVTATLNGTSITLAWTAAALEGAEELTGFIVEDAAGNVYRELGPSARSTVIEGLEPGEHSFTVRSTNQFGNSAPSEPATVTIPLPSTGGGGGGGGGGGTPSTSLPAAPTNVTAARGDGKAVVSWTPPAQQDAITGYLVYVAPGERVISAERSVSSLTVSNLVNGEPYTFAVEAVSARGAGERSAFSAPVVPAGVPAATDGLTAAAGDGSLELSWAEADGNGAEVTGYVLTASPGNREMTVDPGVTTATLTGLENGTEYSLSLVAVNEIGLGAAATTTGTPGTTPTAPDGVEVVAKDGKLQVRWEPATARGYAITGYRVDVAPGGLSTTVHAPETRAVIEGLENGVAYSVSVVALSDVGEGEPAYATDAATPAGEPARIDPPTLVVKKRGIKVSWTAPDARGSSIEGYLVTGTDGVEKSVGAGKSTLIIRGLVRGQSYRFRVQALSDQGPSRQGRWSERLTW